MNLPFLIFNIFLAILIAPLMDGIRRKFTARFQNRIGPPLFQTWYDIIKLFRKETLVPSTGSSLILSLPTITFIVSLTMFATISTVTIEPLMDGSGIIFIELAVLSAFLLAITGSISRNPYGVVGGSREVILAFLIEPSIIVSLTTLLLIKGSTTFEHFPQIHDAELSIILALTAFLLSLIAESGKIPFDVAEAESELTGGHLIEYSGRLLALLKLSILIRTLALFSITKFFFMALIPYPHIEESYAAIIILFFISLLFCTFVISLAESLTTRFRLSNATRFCIGVLAVSLTALLFTILIIPKG